MMIITPSIAKQLLLTAVTLLAAIPVTLILLPFYAVDCCAVKKDRQGWDGHKY